MSTQVAAPAKKRKRGRETAFDMVRSLGLVILVIVPIWFFAQPPSSDSAELRVIDPAGNLDAFAADVPAAPVPGTLPAQWRPTVTTYTGGTSELRVGYVTPREQYAEYAASEAPRDDVLAAFVGEDADQLDPVSIGGVAWEQYRETDGAQSLVRSYGDATVVIGTRRSTATLEELRLLVGSLTTR